MISPTFFAPIGPFNISMPYPNFDNFVLSEYDDSLTDPDIWVQTNNPINKKTKRYRHIFERIKNSGKPWIVVEAPVFRCNQLPIDHSGAYFRWSWFSYFRDQGIHYHDTSPSDRWEQIQQEQQIEILPWRSPGDNILIMMQRPGDSSLVPIAQKWGSYAKFLENILTQIRSNTDRPIKIRLHPLKFDQQMEILRPLMDTTSGVSISDYSTQITDPWVNGGESLYKDLDQSWAVVGANSNSLVESVCYGIPTFSLDSTAMAWPVSHHNIQEINSPNLEISRQQWLNNLGYCQWRRDEIEQGLCLDYLMQWWPEVIEKRKQMPDWIAKEKEEACWYEDNYIKYWINESINNERKKRKLWRE